MALLISLIGVSSVLLFFLQGSVALANGPESENWYTIETDNFRLHYHEGVADIAAEVIEMCEEAHSVLSPHFEYDPALRTTVVLRGGIDTANGSATALPRNRMELIAYPPEFDSVLGNHNNWMWNLIMHEYTHVLHVDSMSDAYRLLNIPLGKIFAPNQLAPRWLIEGLATYLESESTGTGRVNSSLFQMYVRTAALNGTIPSMGSLSGSPLDWPFATGWYLYGSFFMDYVVDQAGWDGILDYIARYGRRFLPFGINVTAEAAFGRSMTDLWEEWNAYAAGEAVGTALARRIAGETAIEFVTSAGSSSRFVVPYTDGSGVGWLDAGNERHTAIVIADLSADAAHEGEPSEASDDSRSDRRGRRGPQEGELARIEMEEITDFSFFPGNERLAFAQRTRFRESYTYFDLWELEVASGDMHQLTFGLRAREPAVSPDGTQIAFVAPQAGRNDLYIFDVASGEARLLFEADAWSQFAQPSWSPDGTHIVASYAREGHSHDIVMLPAAGGAIRYITDDDAQDLEPQFDPSGELLVFTSDRDGIYDVYAVRLADESIGRLTRGHTGWFSPALVLIDDGVWLYGSVYGPHGYDIARTPLTTDWFDAAMPAPAPRVVDRILRPDLDVAISQPRRYPVVLEGLPRTWSPFLTVFAEGINAGASVIGGDPAGIYNYALTLGFNSIGGFPIFGFSLQTRLFYPTIDLELQHLVIPRQTSLISNSRFVPFYEQRLGGRIRASFSFSNMRSRHSLSMDYAPEWRRFLREVERERDPLDIEPREPDLGRRHSLGVGWSWGDLESYSDAISLERGTGLSVGLRFSSPAIGAESSSMTLTASLRHFVPMPWQHHHILALRLVGGAGVDDGGRTSLFSVGGLQPQDVLIALQNEESAPTSTVRGYAPSIRFGNRYFLLNAEYRFPLAELDWGVDTLPLWFSRLHAAVFVDAGNAYSGTFRFEETLLSFGAELRMGVVVSYFRGSGLRMGVARGIGEEGETRFYLVAGGGF